MSNVAIKVENLSKEYIIGHAKTYSGFRQMLTEKLSALFKMRAARSISTEKIWALKGVSFEVKRGEVLGIIGRNGAGKSTLLKILSRITEPTSGRIVMHGRASSLLEVGTGFHPELSGRENVYLNGTILGMKRSEIDRKFDEIIAFAEVEKFIDTPVKHYSSGMYVRLAFAVAAHLEPDILLVDEVLAVGDASFQKKCLGKMNAVVKEGRTILFVSHNLTAVQQLCHRSLLIEGGHIIFYGETRDAIAHYFKTGSGPNRAERQWTDPGRAPGNEHVRVRGVRILSDGCPATKVDIDREVFIEIDFWLMHAGLRNICVSVNVLSSTGIPVLCTLNTPAANLFKDAWYGEPHAKGLYRSRCTIPANFLNEGTYYISVYMMTLGPINVEAQTEHTVLFEVHDTGVMRESGGGSYWAGLVRPRLPWQTEYLGGSL